MMDMERKRMYQTYVGLKDMERKQALIALVTHRINFNNRWRKKSDVKPSEFATLLSIISS